MRPDPTDLESRDDDPVRPTDPVLDSRRTSRSQFRRLKGYLVLGVIAAGLLLCFSYYVQGNRTLHVCNGLNQDLKVVIDGRELRVPPRSHSTLILTEGSHTFDVKEPALAVTNGSFDMTSHWLKRCFNKSAFVLDPTRSSVIAWAEATYAANVEDSRIDNRFHLNQSYLQFDQVDFVFKGFPESIELKRGQSQKRSGIKLVAEDPSSVMMFLAGQIEASLLLDFAERHLSCGDSSKDLLRGYMNQLGLQNQFERGFQFLATGIKRRPLEMEWHRAYQSVGQRTNRTAEITDEYSKLAEENPNDSMILYLRGRIDADALVAASYFEQSIAADATNPYPLYAACHQDRARGRYASAKQAVEAALKLDPENREMDEILFQIRLALGEAETLEQELLVKLQEKPTSYQLHIALLMTLAAQGKLTDAKQRQDLFAVRLKQDWPDDPFDLVAGSDRLLAYLTNDFELMLAKSQSIKQPKLREVLVFESMVELGRFEELEQTQFADHAPQRGYQKLTIALGFLLQGNREKSNQWFDAALADFQQGDNETLSVTRAFEATESSELVQRLDRISFQSDERVLIALMAASRCTGESRSTLIGWAEQLNKVPTYPQKFVARVIEHLRK